MAEQPSEKLQAQNQLQPASQIHLPIVGILFLAGSPIAFQSSEVGYLQQTGKRTSKSTHFYFVCNHH
jgi:hypothetical protein